MDVALPESTPYVAAAREPVPARVVRSAIASTSAPYRATKRLLDVVGSLVALVLVAPVGLLIALLIRCTSPGPVLFRQKRVGRDGRLFNVLKFRSMCADAEGRLRDLGLYDTYVASGYKLPAEEDERVTRIGRVLRRTSLDELPQLLNVLRGEMSLVGPRPVEYGQLSSYGDLAHCYLGVRPGLTGIWQVSGRSDIHFPERAYLDLSYFDRRSVWTDLRILARTPMAVVRGRGAH